MRTLKEVPFAPLAARADAGDWRTLRLLALLPRGTADLPGRPGRTAAVDTASGYDADAMPHCACAGLAHFTATAAAP